MALCKWSIVWDVHGHANDRTCGVPNLLLFAGGGIFAYTWCEKICDAAWTVCVALRDTVWSGIQQQNTRIQLSECLFYFIYWFADDDRLPCSGRKRRVGSGMEGDLIYPDRGSRNGTGVFFKDRLCRKRCILYHGLIHFPQEKNVAAHRRMCIIHLGDTGAVRLYPDRIL